MRDLWRRIVAELMTPDDFQRDWYGHATNQAGHAWIIGFPVGLVLAGIGPIWAAYLSGAVYLAVWELAIQRRGRRADQIEDAGHVALGALCGAGCASGWAVAGWLMSVILIAAGVLRRIRSSPKI